MMVPSAQQPRRAPYGMLVGATGCGSNDDARPDSHVATSHGTARFASFVHFHTMDCQLAILSPHARYERIVGRTVGPKKK
jgi:hypothetical protein